jgi:hypothetical protein
MRDMEPSNRIICIKVRNGLANRLRTLNSFYNFAEENNFELRVLWGEGAGWSDEKFYDLFQKTKLKFINEKEYEEFSKNKLNLDKVIYKNEKNPDEYIHEIEQNSIIDFIKKNSFCYCGDSCIEYMLSSLWHNYGKYDFIKSLKFKPEIQNKIKNISKSFNKNTVGIHIRRGDSSTSPWKDKFGISDNESFVIKINEEMEANPDCNFFLSTDCEDTNNYFVNKFPNLLWNKDKKFFKNINHLESKPGQKDALIDLILLSKTKKIIGSNWSSFSYISSKINKIPLIIAKKQEVKLVPKKEETISLICSVKNRTDMLKISIQSWIKHKDIKEYVIVDWSSDEDISYLSKLDDRIKVIRVENEKYFSVVKAPNLAIKNTCGDLIIKMDVDYILNPYYDFFQEYKIKKNEFLTGNWEDFLIDNDMGFIRYLHGFLYAHRENLIKIGGYNELMKNYGYEDCDIFNRLTDIGLERKYLNHNKPCIIHMPHPDSVRSENYENKDIMETLTDNYKISNGLE